MVKADLKFTEPAKAEDTAGNGTGEAAHKLLRIIIHTSHSGDSNNVQFFNRLYPEWGPRHLNLPRNEEVVVDSRLLPRLDEKCSLTTKVDKDSRPVRDPETGDVVKIKKLRFPYTILGDA